MNNKIICILGIPGSGKTTVGNSLSRLYKVKFLEEAWTGIPFLFPENIVTSSQFEINVGFLNMRYNQNIQASIHSKDTHVVLDTCITMSDIYSKRTMHDYEYSEFKKVFNIYKKDISEPSLYVYLKGDVNVVYKRMLKRNEAISDSITEKVNIKLDDLVNFKNDIDYFLSQASKDKILEIDINTIDLREDINIKSFFDRLMLALK